MLNFRPRSAPDADSAESREAKPAPKSAEEIEAAAQDRIGQTSKIHVAEADAHTAEDAESDYLLFLMEHGEIEPDTPVDFAGLKVPLNVFTEDFPRWCCELEQEMGIDLKTLPPDTVADLLADKIATAKQLKDETDTVAVSEGKAEVAREAETVKTSELGANDAYTAWIARFDTTTALIESLDTMPVDDYPELAAEKAKLEPYRRILALAQTESDRALMVGKINALPPTGMPPAMTFIQSEIFSSSDHDTGFSAEMQEAVAREFGVPRKRLATGTDLANAMDEKTLNPETGKEEPVYGADNKLLVRKTPSAAGDIYMHVADNGDRVVEVTLSDGRHREINMPPGPDMADQLRTWTSLLGLYAQLEEDGSTDFLGEGVNIDTAITNIRDPFKRVKLENTINAMIGGSAGFDGRVLYAEDYAQIGRYVNYLGAEKGDAQTGDFDRPAAIARRTKLGIHPDGDPQTIRYEVLRAACLYMQENWLGAEPSYDALQAHLAKLFPEFVAPPEADPGPEQTIADT